MKSTFRRFAPVAAVALLAALAAPNTTSASSFATEEEQDTGRSQAYRDAQQALSYERWAEAAAAFREIADAGSYESDAALYWQAYAEYKRQRAMEALQSLRQLQSAYPDSAWIDDARALEMEVRGDREPVEESSDETLKLYALNSLMQMDAERAVPVLERLLAGDQGPKIKERALFILSQTDSPKAREILIRTARTGEPASLRIDAIQALGISGEPEDLQALAALAGEAGTPYEVRRALVDAYMIADAHDALAQLAESDPDTRIRGKAVEALGALDALPTLRRLWESEKDPAIRRKLLSSFGIAGDVETLAGVARTATDPATRRRAIEGLAIADSAEAGIELEKLYTTFTDARDRRKVLEAFMIQGDAERLIALFRSETDPEMKKLIVQQLSFIDDPAATELLLGLLEVN
jgi:HEAT repeat protein